MCISLNHLIEQFTFSSFAISRDLSFSLNGPPQTIKKSEKKNLSKDFSVSLTTNHSCMIVPSLGIYCFLVEIVSLTKNHSCMIVSSLGIYCLLVEIVFLTTNHSCMFVFLNWYSLTIFFHINPPSFFFGMESLKRFCSRTILIQWLLR